MVINSFFLYNITNREYNSKRQNCLYIGIPIHKCLQNYILRTELTLYGIENISVNHVLKICFKTTNDSSVQWLQFRILRRIFSFGYNIKKKIT